MGKDVAINENKKPLSGRRICVYFTSMFNCTISCGMWNYIGIALYSKHGIIVTFYWTVRQSVQETTDERGSDVLKVVGETAMLMIISRNLKKI